MSEIYPVKEKLKPCPFCGDEPGNDVPFILTKKSIPGHPTHQVACECCDARGPSSDTVARALEAWQHREELKP